MPCYRSRNRGSHCSKLEKKIIFTKNFVKLITHENSKSIFFVNSEVLKNDLGNKHTTMLKRSEKKTHNFYICTLFKVALEKKIKMRIWYEYLRVFWKHLLEFCLIPLQYFFVWTPLKYYIARIVTINNVFNWEII